MNDDRTLGHPAPDHPVSAPADTSAVFADLVCADPGLLRVEFDALIAANFPPADVRRFRRTPRRPGPTRTQPALPLPAARSVVATGSPAPIRAASAPDRRARQRSPPAEPR